MVEKKTKKLSPQGIMDFTREQIGLGVVTNAGPAMIGFLPSFPGQAGTMQAMKPLRIVPRIHAAGYFIGAFGEMGDEAFSLFEKPKKKRK